MRQVIITGIHGGGTSFISECVSRAGIPMWGRKADSIHFEDADILEANIACLEEMNLQWHDSVLVNHNENLYKRLQEYRDSKQGDYGFKEPRITMLLPVYKKVWPDAKYICCVRNPLNAAMSRKNAYPSIEVGLKKSINDMAATLKHDIHYFNYDGNMNEEERKLSEYIGRKVEIVKYWNK